MRAAVIPIFLAAALAAQAETIVLKNGRKILADSVREENGRIYYEVGEGSYAIPKTSVDHIESFGTAERPRHGDRAVQQFVPQDTLSGPGRASDVIKDGRVDDEAIAAAERSGNPDLAAAANYAAGRLEIERGNREGAARYFDRALRFRPESAPILSNYAAVLVQMGRPRDAVPIAEHATRVAPDSPDAYAVLGYACMQADRSADAIRAFEHSLQLRPDTTVQQFLAKARRETTTEAEYTQTESSHFTLRFEGKQVDRELTRGILERLDDDYEDLVREIGVAPRGSITVILYADQAFFDVTHAPSWSGAINDGRLRIPVSGINAMTGELARVLRHELTHSFVTLLSRGRCPFWLNEGVAQLLEPRTTYSVGRVLAPLYAADRQVPLNFLEGSFTGLSSAQASLAYAESLAAVEYINETYGMSDVRRLIERIGEGASGEAALRATLNVGYGQFEQDVGTYLRSKYGE